MKLFFIFCFLLVFVPASHAEDFPMLHYSVEDGLPSTNVYSIYRDSKGYLWFATDKGIARYNGLRFETFTTSDGMPDNEIFFFREDRQHRLWLGVYNGELCFYKDGVFHNSSNTPWLKMPRRQAHISNITVEKDSSVTFNFYDVSVVVNIKNEQLNLYDFRRVKHISDYYAYIGYKKKVADGIFDLVYPDMIMRVDSACNVLSFEKRKWAGMLVYVSSQDYGYIINTPSLVQEQIGGNGKCILSQDLDSVATFAGKAYEGKTIRSYYSNGKLNFIATSNGVSVNDSIWILPGVHASSVTQDADGNYWVSSLNDGVYRLSKDFLSLKVYRSLYRGKINFAKITPRGLYFVPENKNLYRLQHGRVTRELDYEDLARHHRFYNEDAYFMSNSGDMFVNFKSIDYIVRDIDKAQTKVYNYRRPGPNYGGVKHTALDNDRMILFGYGGISSFNYAGLTKGITDYRDIFYTDKERIYGIATDARYGVWFSMVSGTYRVLRDKVQEVPQLKMTQFKLFTILGDKLVGVTQKNDLLLVHNIAGKIVIDTVPPQNCVWTNVYTLDPTHVLLSSSNMCYIVAVDKDQYQVYPVEDRIVPQQASHICIDSTGCYFFKGETITVLPKSAVLTRAAPPHLYFTTVKAGKKEYHTNVSIVNDQLDLSYNEASNLVLSFAKVLISGQGVVQQYSVSGDGQDNWRDVQGNSIAIVDPGYGDYKVKVRAKTLSSDFCTPIVFTFHIARPFWATWWFLLGVASAVVFLVILIVRSRVSYLLQKSQREHQNEMKFVKSEYKALNALMNPHFVFNTLNNVQGLVNRDDKLAANEYIRVFADLIRQNMYNLSKEMITLQKEMELVVNYLLLEKLRFKELLNYSIEVDDNFDLSEIFVPPLLVQPLVENSIKHGILPLESVEGTVIIRIYEKDALLLIQVRDNGVGLAKARENKGDSAHESFAMENIKKRIEQLAIILDKQIMLDLAEEREPGDERGWTVVTVSMLI